MERAGEGGSKGTREEGTRPPDEDSIQYTLPQTGRCGPVMDWVHMAMAWSWCIIENPSEAV